MTEQELAALEADYQRNGDWAAGAGDGLRLIAEVRQLHTELAEARAAMHQAHGKAQTIAHYDAVGILERAIARIDRLLANEL